MIIGTQKGTVILTTTHIHAPNLEPERSSESSNPEPTESLVQTGFRF